MDRSVGGFADDGDDELGRDIESGATASGNGNRDLSEWQERHATLLLARIKELAQIRYVCPRQMSIVFEGMENQKETRGSSWEDLFYACQESCCYGSPRGEC